MMGFSLSPSCTHFAYKSSLEVVGESVIHLLLNCTVLLESFKWIIKKMKRIRDGLHMPNVIFFGIEVNEWIYFLVEWYTVVEYFRVLRFVHD